MKGKYVVRHEAKALLEVEISRDDDEVIRSVPRLCLPAGNVRHRALAAAIRSGCRHPGLEARDLARLHALAHEYRHIELFADVNAICTGLLGHVVRSLGTRLARVVVASSTVDVLQEYADLNHGRRPRYLRHGEVARSISLLDELRQCIPVHIHQLPPGATRHQRRQSDGIAAPCAPAVPVAAQEEDDLVLSEDRVMIAAYWDYHQRDLPRLPVVFLTSDHALAQACAMEQIPFCFARSPQEVIARDPSGSIPVESLWFDPSSLTLRYSITSDVVFELATTFREVELLDADGRGWRVTFDPRHIWPGAELSVACDPVASEALTAVPHSPAPSSSSAAAPPGRIDIALAKVLAVVPTDPGMTTSLDDALIRDKNALRQLLHIGKETDLFSVRDTTVSAGSTLPSLLLALRDHDYDTVNSIFRRVPAYRAYLDRVDPRSGKLPNDPKSRAPGWAVTLGAAYKVDGGLVYGLSVVDDADFALAVRDAHAKLAEGAPAASLPLVVDSVCCALRMSPVRVVAQLNRCLAPGGTLHTFDVQRAKRDEAVPKKHPILSAPGVDRKFVRELELGRGIELQSRLAGTLVNRRKDAP
ncbi:MAG: hypothetical protein HY909_11875 [Deltaproteobacteria bacterium]|nr:hypothetical protein [Deltaproteobacteria bacterium]